MNAKGLRHHHNLAMYARASYNSLPVCDSIYDARAILSAWRLSVVTYKMSNVSVLLTGLNEVFKKGVDAEGVDR